MIVQDFKRKYITKKISLSKVFETKRKSDNKILKAMSFRGYFCVSTDEKDFKIDISRINTLINVLEYLKEFDENIVILNDSIDGIIFSSSMNIKGKIFKFMKNKNIVVKKIVKENSIFKLTYSKKKPKLKKEIKLPF